MTDIPVKSALRVLELFELLGRASGELQHSELAEALAIPKSSLTQLLRTLVDRGWITFSPGSKGYSLGPKLPLLTSRHVGEVDLLAAAPDVIATLASATGETSALNLRKGDEQEVVVTQLSEQRLLSMMRAGDRAPLYATSGGKAMLAGLPDDELDAYLDRVSFEPITSNTHRSVAALKADLAKVKKLGYAVSREEYTAGVVGLARPVLTNHLTGSVAVSVAIPATRLSESLQADALRHLARAAAALGGTGAPRRSG